MDLINDYIDPITLTGFARTALADLQENQFTLSKWLPNQTVDDVDWRADTTRGGLAKAAKFRTWDAESPISGRRGLSRLMGELPPISEKKVLGEHDRIKLRRLQNNDSIVNAIFDDTRELILAISARIELARGEILATGKLVLHENGVESTVDFGRKASHTVTAALPWSNPSSTPLADMRTWSKTFKASTGAKPAAFQTSDRVFESLMLHPEFRALVATLAGTPGLVTQETVQSVLVAYGLPRIEIYDAQVDLDGVATEVIPDDKFLLLSSSGLGATYWGVTAEAMEAEYALGAGDQSGIVAGSYKSKDPVQVWTKSAAIALPVLANPDNSFAADVL